MTSNSSFSIPIIFALLSVGCAVDPPPVGSEETPGEQAEPAPFGSWVVDPQRPQVGDLRAGDEDTEALGHWLADELWVSVDPDASAEQVAMEHGSSLRRPAGPSGLAVVRVPDGVTLSDFERELSYDARVTRVGRVSRMKGASRGGPAEVSDLQWHLGVVGLPEHTADLSGVVVAVLDTGVAFEDHDGRHAAESLAGVNVVAPYDFVHGDAHPEDDHLHGTHLASLIASSGHVRGVAEGVSLMPIKVLGADNRGSEADLIDGLYWAVDNGADVINLSLVLPAGYSPSAPLQEALSYAHDAGVLLVGAAGNDGDGRSLYPAASPLVLSVAASSVRNPSEHQFDPTDYSNLSSAVDVLAPGGDLSVDNNHDGYPDGLLAEGPPSADGEPRYYLYAGTSQATALVSAAAAHLVAEGARCVDEVRDALAASLNPSSSDFSAGLGVGNLDIEAALDAVCTSPSGDHEEDDDTSAEPVDVVYGMVLPYLAAEGRGEVEPRAWISVVDAEGQALDLRGTAFASVWSVEGWDTVSCSYSSALGGCEVSLDAVSLTDESGRALAAGWSFSVDGLFDRDQDRMLRPRRGVFVTGALVNLVEALGQDGLLEDSALAVAWSDTEDPLLGELSAGYTLLDLGVGQATRPSGLLLTPALVESLSLIEPIEVNLDGTGLVTEPMGIVDLSRIWLDGSGLVTEPMGFTGTRLIAINGTGLVTEPMGFHAMDLFSVAGSGLVTEPMGFTSELLRLDGGSFSTLDLGGTAFDSMLDQGGWLVGQGEQAPAWFTSGGLLGQEEGHFTISGVGYSEL